MAKEPHSKNRIFLTDKTSLKADREVGGGGGRTAPVEQAARDERHQWNKRNEPHLLKKQNITDKTSL